MADLDASGSEGPHAQRRFLTFRMADQLYALEAADVAEVIRAPEVARVPQSPKSLLGLANLRGEVMPVASLPGLLGRPVADRYGRAIVLSGAAPVAIAVEGVEALVSIEGDKVETDQAGLGANPGEVLKGAFKTGAGHDVAKVLDIQALLSASFVQRARAPRQAQALAAHLGAEIEIEDERKKFISFEVAGQEYALGLDDVREIVPAPEHLTALPRAETLVLGMTSYRDRLLPLLSLRGLLGLPASAGGGKVVVTSVGGLLVGLLVDRMRAIVPADPALIEPIPSVLSARTGGEAQIKAIYRGEGGRRLISILAPELLFREDVMTRLRTGEGGVQNVEAAPSATAERQFLVFRLGGEEFGLPIEVVDEVANAPAQVTRVPKTPDFLEGVVNLRGEVLPVVDQRRRFDMPPAQGGAQRRLIVVRTERHRAGLIVDSVSEVLRSTAEAIDQAPDLTGETTRLVNGVINLEGAGRMVLVLDPSELLSRTERGLLDAFGGGDRDGL